MGKIVDLSHHNAVDWSKAKDELDLAIIRVQYGSTIIDRKYKEFVAACKRYNIPFGHYAYCLFVSINDAIVEAKDFLSRADKDAKFLVADVEEMTTRNPADIVPATQAFIDTCKAAGWKVGLYTGHSFYKQYGMNRVKADFLWIPRYAANDVGQPTGFRPDMPCDLWQYTQKGKLAGASGDVDLNMLVGNKTLEWFIGTSTVIRYIYTGGFAGPALEEVHNYLLTTRHHFDVKRGFDGSIIFLIGPFDTSMQNYADCKSFLDSRSHYNKLLTPEEAANWR